MADAAKVGEAAGQGRWRTGPLDRRSETVEEVVVASVLGHVVEREVDGAGDGTGFTEPAELVSFS